MTTEHMMTVSQMETPKAPSGLFTLPCGYLDLTTNEVITDVEIREISGREEDMLASEAVPAEQKLTALISGCVMRIGSITDKGRIAKIADELPVGDRVFLLFAIRRVTLGNDFPVREKCPNSDCKAENLFVVDLSELDVKPMPEPHKRVYDVKLPSGRACRFRVSVGADEARAARIAKKKALDGVSQMILMRLEALDDTPPTLNIVQSMGKRDRDFLREQFDEVEGGVDTSIELECPNCGYEWEKDLSVASASFFSPSATRKRSKKKSSG